MLTIQRCRQCSEHVRDAANFQGLRIKCPFCKVAARFSEGQFQINPNNNEFPLMVCELCTRQPITIVCLPCLHIRICEQCCQEATAGGNSNCPICGQHAEFQRGYFP